MTKHHSGIAPSTILWKADGNKIEAGQVAAGDTLLGPDGGPVKVAKIVRAKADSYRRTLKSMHKKTDYTGIIMPTIVCSTDSIFEMGTSQVVKNYIKQSVNYKPTPKRMVVITVMREHTRPDDSTIDLPYNVSKQFDFDASDEEVDEYITAMTVPGVKRHIWHGSIDDMQMVKGDARISTRGRRAKVAIVRPYFRDWLRRRYAGQGIGPMNDERVKAMAWMLGFWLGDGCRGGAIFALHSEDHDVNGHLERAAKLWRMKYVFRKMHGSEFQAQCRLDYYPLSKLKKSSWKENILVTTLCGLGFYINHTINCLKGGPLFMAADELMVQIQCLCGLIDSDGTTALYDNVLRIKLVTIYPPIRDLIIALARNLRVSVTSTFEAAHITNQNAQAKDTWIIHLFTGQNPRIFNMILENLACERKRNPPVRMSKRYRKQIGEEVTDSEEERESGENDSSSDSDFDEPITLQAEIRSGLCRLALKLRFLIYRVRPLSQPSFKYVTKHI